MKVKLVRLIFVEVSVDFSSYKLSIFSFLFRFCLTAMTSVQAIVEKFVRMRLTLNNVENAEEAKAQLQSANQSFHALYENWITMPPDQQEQTHGDYVDAQRDFHIIGSALVEKINPTPLFGSLGRNGEIAEDATMDVSGNNVVDTKESESQTENPNAEIQQQPMEFEHGDQKDQQQQVPTSSGESTNNVGNSNDEISQPKGVVISQITLQQLANGIQNAVQIALEKPVVDAWEDTKPLQDLCMATYKEQWDLMAPIFSLVKQENLSKDAIETAIVAIDELEKRFESKGFKHSPQTKRMVIMHIVSMLDKETQNCWKYRNNINDPTVESFVNFLIERKSDAIGCGFKIPKIKPNQIASTEQHRGRLNEKATTSTDRSRSNSRSAKATGDSEKRCSFCNQTHILKECVTFSKLSMQQREVEVTNRALCKNCFSIAHNTARCTKNACKKCQHKHNPLLLCR